MKNSLKVIIVFAWLLSSLFAIGGKQPVATGWRVDFTVVQAKLLAENWQIETLFGTPKTTFNLEQQAKKQALVVSAKKSSGALVTTVKSVDLHKTPIMRWRWRVTKLPSKADGRITNKDDQALAIYVGIKGGYFSQKTLAYRWETETPRDASAKTSYILGTMKVKWFCLRNKSDQLGKWYTEQRNIADDFKQIYGVVPDKFALSIAANSQHTQSSTRAEIQWVEFVSETVETEPPAEQLLVQLASKKVKPAVAALNIE
jgi:Protein of unknown function (DUF3047)